MSKTKSITLLLTLIAIVIFGIYFIPRTAEAPVIPLVKEKEIMPNYNDAGFDVFVKDVIELRCPYYKPDGITYRECLSDWEQSLVAQALPEGAYEVHAYCDTFTKMRAELDSLEGSELFLKCSIYTFQ